MVSTPGGFAFEELSLSAHRHIYREVVSMMVMNCRDPLAPFDASTCTHNVCALFYYLLLVNSIP